MGYFLLNGNFIIVIIGGLSILALAISFDRFFYIRKIERANMMFFRDFYKGSYSDRNGVLEFCRQTMGVLAPSIVKSVLESPNRRNRVAYIEESIESQVFKIESRISIIGTIASVAPLLGLLGTVLGMIDSLRVLETDIRNSSTDYAGGLLAGMWTALTTTAAGLIVAIPSLAVYNYLINKLNKFVGSVKMEIGSVLDKLDNSLV